MAKKSREEMSPWVIGKSDTVHRRTCTRYARVWAWPWVDAEDMTTFVEPTEYEVLGHLVGEQKVCGFCFKDLAGEIERTDRVIGDVRRARGLLGNRGEIGSIAEHAAAVLNTNNLNRESVTELAAELVAVLEWL